LVFFIVKVAKIVLYFLPIAHICKHRFNQIQCPGFVLKNLNSLKICLFTAVHDKLLGTWIWDTNNSVYMQWSWTFFWSI